MIEVKRKSRGWSVFLFALFILLCYYPYEFYSIYFYWFLPDNFLNSQALFFALVFVLVVFSNRKKVLPLKMLGIFMVQFIGFTRWRN